MIPKNQLERLFNNRYYGYNRVTCKRNSLIGITLQELCSSINAKFVETKYIGKDYHGQKIYLTVVRNLRNLQYRGYVTKLSEDESIYTIRTSGFAQGVSKRDLEHSYLLLKNELKTKGYLD